MTAELTSLEGCRRKLHVELPAEDVAAAYKRIIRDYQNHAELPGFRKGKAPVSAIERRFGANIAQDVNQFLTGRAWRDAVKEKDIKAKFWIGEDTDLIRQFEIIGEDGVYTMQYFDYATFDNDVTLPSEMFRFTPDGSTKLSLVSFETNVEIPESVFQKPEKLSITEGDK